MGGRPSSEASQSPNARKIDAYCRRVLADAARAAIRSASPNRFRSVNVRTVLYQVIGTPTRPHGPYTLFQQLADEVVKGETIREDDARQKPMAESVGPAAADPGRVWLRCAWSSWR